MRRQRRKRHGKRGRGDELEEVKRGELSLLAQLVGMMPQWTTGGVRQHERGAVLMIRIKV